MVLKLLQQKQNMIPDSQVIEIITEQFPDIELDCPKSRVYKAFECISVYADRLLKKQAYEEFKQFINFVNQLHFYGNNRIKTCIDNIFLYNLSNYIDLSSDPHATRQLLPTRMRTILQKQHGSSAI
ncbi:MAG TPA: hypothetical protein VEB40_07125 [Flavipsychrobacter sp.]|nr:hypothetical protein [Flavipsychrobacter sp.]